MRDKITVCYEIENDNKAVILVVRENEDRNIIINKYEDEAAIELYKILIGE